MWGIIKVNTWRESLGVCSPLVLPPDRPWRKKKPPVSVIHTNRSLDFIQQTLLCAGCWLRLFFVLSLHPPLWSFSEIGIKPQKSFPQIPPRKSISLYALCRCIRGLDLIEKIVIAACGTQGECGFPADQSGHCTR